MDNWQVYPVRELGVGDGQGHQWPVTARLGFVDLQKVVD